MAEPGFVEPIVNKLLQRETVSLFVVVVNLVLLLLSDVTEVLLNFGKLHFSVQLFFFMYLTIFVDS